MGGSASDPKAKIGKTTAAEETWPRRIQEVPRCARGACRGRGRRHPCPRPERAEQLVGTESTFLRTGPAEFPKRHRFWGPAAPITRAHP